MDSLWSSGSSPMDWLVGWVWHSLVAQQPREWCVLKFSEHSSLFSSQIHTLLLPFPFISSHPTYLEGSLCLQASRNLWLVYLGSWSPCAAVLGSPQALGGTDGESAGLCPKLDQRSCLQGLLLVFQSQIWPPHSKEEGNIKMPTSHPHLNL